MRVDIPSFPLTHAQLELAIASLVAPGTALGVTGGTMDIFGVFDQDRFLAAFKAAHYSVASLNLRFSFVGDEVRQFLESTPQDVCALYQDASDRHNPTALVHDFLALELKRGIDLFSDEPLVRHYLFKLGAQHHRYAILTHHTMIDGWGFSVWVKLMANAYAGEATVSPSFLDHVQMVESVRQNSPARKRALAHWLGKLPSPPTPLFQCLHPGEMDVVQSRLTVTAARYGPWESLALAEGVSMASLVTAALLQELAALTGQSRPVVGLPIHRRSTPATKQTVGLFASVLPLVVNMVGGERLGALAARIQQVQRTDFRNSDITLAEISRAWNLRGNQSDPLQVTLSFEKHDYNIAIAGCEVLIDAFAPAAQLRPLQIYWRQYQDGRPIHVDTSINVGYASQQLSPRLISNVFERLDKAAGVAVEQLPTSSPTRLPQTAPASHLLADQNLWALFERVCANAPDAVAVVDEDGSRLSYRGLHQQALRVAGRLLDLGLKPESFVGLCADRNSRLVAHILGILAAGCAYVPIDPGYPRERLRYLVSDSGLRCVFADNPAHVAALDLEGVAVLDMAAAPAHPGHDQVLPKVQSGFVAYMIYTSGSTGQPKGCMVSHGNVLALLGSVRPIHDYRSDDVWTLFHSYAFDFSVWELWGAFANGARVVIVSQSTSRDPDLFYELLLRENVTVLSQTPTAFRSLSSHSDWLSKESPSLALRRVIFGGEALDPSILRPCFERFGRSILFTNMYGITETTVHVTHRDIGPDDMHLGSVIGPALPNWQIYVLDEHLRPTGSGEVGEIYVGGLGVSRGYHRRPRLTAERMLPDVFQGDGSRMYRSGDLARVRADGEVEYMGRMDHQVKIRGFRIELGEIEACLRQIDAVGDAVVLPWRDDSDEELRLVAWVTPACDHHPSEVALRTRLQASLPSHLVPSRFITIASLPLTLNGKLDRERLPTPSRALQAGTNLHDSQRTELGVLLEVWKAVLDREASADANFFALGGDSLMALRMVARLRTYGYELSLADVYRQPDALACVRNLRPLNPSLLTAESADTANFTEGVEDIFPMMALQAGMLYHTEIAPDSNVFQDVFDFEIQHPWDAPRFQQAVDDLVNWAPALRTHFDWDSHDRPSLIIHKTAQLPVAVIDLRGMSGPHQLLHVEQSSLAERSQPFDLARLPQMRITVHVLDKQRFWITVAFHHAILDGWSFASLMATLLAHYLGELTISKLPRQDSIQKTASLRELQASDDPALKSFWLERLKNLTPPSFRNSKRRTSVQRLCQLYDAQVMANVTATAKRAGISLRSVLLGTHMLAQMCWRQSARITSGCVLNCRPELPGADQAFGLFLNTLPFTVQMPGHQVSAVDWLKSLAQDEAALLAHRWFPLPELLKLAKTDSLFDCGFNFIHFHVYAQRMGAKIDSVNSYKVFERTELPLLCQFAIEPSSHTLELSLVSNLEELGTPELERFAALYALCLNWLCSLTSTGTPAFFSELAATAADTETAAVSITASETYLDSPPATWRPLERELAQIWSEVLGLDVLNRDATFFELGGDSISATRMVAKLRKHFGLQIRLKNFFAEPTVRGAASTLELTRKAMDAPTPMLDRTPIPKAVRRNTAKPDTAKQAEPTP